MSEKRCPWAVGEYNIAYHDQQWGKVVTDDQTLFAFLVLEGMQAGLSWETILKKRDAFYKAFDDFDIDTVANYDETKCASLLQNQGIIRNRLKIKSAVQNAKCVQRIQKEFGSFFRYLWQFTDGKQINHKLTDQKDMPAHDALSDRISKDLKKRGCSFVGSTIIYSFLQAIGMINDHLVWCKEYQPSIDSAHGIDIFANDGIHGNGTDHS